MGEVWKFLMKRKAWWLTPIIIVIVFILFMIIFGDNASPFNYALF